MNEDHLRDARVRRVWLHADTGCVEDFEALIALRTEGADWPLAATVEHGVPVYDGETVHAVAADREARRTLMAEWAECVDTGPGIIVIRRAFDDTTPIDRANVVFDDIIDMQRQADGPQGDHFAKPGANDRIWNSLEKHCLADPEGFASYYANAAIALPSEAWLGPGYQVTAQVNRVNPGGDAQTGHRDYHLGFMTPVQAARYPAHVHRLSPALTLQGAIAHCDMPVETGPTLYLPYSQRFANGYLAFSRPEFQALFDAHRVQLPLAKGDAVFFNPALMHAAGANRSNGMYRMANLLQVSSAFGRAMESVNRERMVLTLYPVLANALGTGVLSMADAERVLAASAEAYAFPTNLDRDPPVDGLAPATQLDRVRAFLVEGASAEVLAAELRSQARRR